jgi:hypothetical protein
VPSELLLNPLGLDRFDGRDAGSVLRLGGGPLVALALRNGESLRVLVELLRLTWRIDF